MNDKLRSALLGGKLIIPTDETVRFTVGVNPSGNVVVDFGKDVKCLVLTPDGAMDLARILMEHARKVRQ